MDWARLIRVAGERLYRAWEGEDYAPPCRLPDSSGPGWVVKSLESGHVDLLLLDARILEPLNPVDAYELSCQLRDHALALGGIVYYHGEGDVERRDRLRREQRDRYRALPTGTLWP